MSLTLWHARKLLAQLEGRAASLVVDWSWRRQVTA